MNNFFMTASNDGRLLLAGLHPVFQLHLAREIWTWCMACDFCTRDENLACFAVAIQHYNRTFFYDIRLVLKVESEPPDVIGLRMMRIIRHRHRPATRVASSSCHRADKCE